MGINSSAFKLILEEYKKRPFSGKVLLLGNQYYFQNLKETKADLDNYKINYDSSLLNLSDEPKQKEGQFVDFSSILNSLKIEEVDIMDFSDYEGANIIQDLNILIKNQDIVDKYDLIIDGGTLEHIFHIPNAFENFFKLLKIGGRIVHFAPSSNHVDHGFYMFSPTLFHDYYTANNYKINEIYLYSYRADNLYGFWTLYEYFPGALHKLQLGGLDNKMYGVYCVCEKQVASTFNKIPLQTMYSKNLWIGDKNKVCWDYENLKFIRRI
jgi:hypothetical protein